MANHYRPLLFHKVHGKNILLNNNSIAYRSDGHNGGITFSNRPIMVQELVHFKILETTTDWSGSVRIGFTINDPKLMECVPDNSLPDLVKTPGNWVKALPDEANVKGAVISFYVDMNGDVFYRINNKKKKILLMGVQTSGKIWAVIDISANTVSVELLDPVSRFSKENGKYSAKSSLTFHHMYLRDTDLIHEKNVAHQSACLSVHSYVFTNRPLKQGEIVKLEICEVDSCNPGTLEYGITSCDPSNINPATLPEETEQLLDRPEYWLVQDDANRYTVGDIITFEMNSEGKITVLRNEVSVSAIFYVDNSQPLWFFFKLSGHVTSISINGFYENAYKNISELMKDLTLSSDTEQKTGSSGEKFSSNECVICYENPVNCVLYRCGHLCLCVDCAQSLSGKNSKPQCPVCRKEILDIIKVYT